MFALIASRTGSGRLSGEELSPDLRRGGQTILGELDDRGNAGEVMWRRRSLWRDLMAQHQIRHLMEPDEALGWMMDSVREMRWWCATYSTFKAGGEWMKTSLKS